MKVLYFPIVSMRSKEDFVYDLTCDGNVNRFMTWISDKNSGWENGDAVRIVIPAKVTEKSKHFIHRFRSYINGFKRWSVEFIWDDQFYDNPPDQRQDIDNLLYDLAVEQIKEYQPQEIVVESNALAWKIANTADAFDSFFKLTYWCPVLMAHLLKDDDPMKDEYIGMDKETMIKCDEIIVATDGERKWIRENVRTDAEIVVNNNFISFNDIFFKKMLPDCNESKEIQSVYTSKHIFFFPFRITDKGYKIDKVLDACDILSKKFDDFMLLYTNPNCADDTAIKAKSYAKQALSDRTTYYAWLQDPRVIVPYLENLDLIWHASANEITYLAENVISMKSGYFQGISIQSEEVTGKNIAKAAESIWKIQR